MHLFELPPVFRLLMYAFSFMAFCSACGGLHPKLRGPAGKPIRQAINSWWLPAIAAGITVTTGTLIGVTVVAGMSIWTFHEYVRMLPADGRTATVEIFAYLAVPLHYGLLLMGTPLLAAGTAAWVFGVLPLAWLFTAGPRGVLTGLPRLQWGAALTVVGISYVAQILTLGSNIRPAGGAGLAAFLFTAVMTNDAAQYVFGKSFGRTSLAHTLSPKKTWEGFAGGLFTTAIISALAGPLVTPFNARQGAFMGAVLSAAGLLGDLLISGIKRDAGVKDTGAVLPQHGGVLDRCDSLLIAAPLFFYGVQAWLQ